jgi:hypothetical protein
MTAKEELINNAILELRHQGVGYQEIFDQLARQIREPELFLVLVRVGPNYYKIHVGDKSTTCHNIASLVAIFTSAALKADGVTEQLEIVPGNQGVPFTLDPAASARMTEELAKDPPSGVRRDPDPAMRIQIAEDERRAQESRKGEELGIPPRLDG